MSKKTAVESIEELDRAAVEQVRGARGSLAFKPFAAIASMGDQEPMLAVSGATLGLGLLFGNRRLARAGGRMLAAEIVATGMKAVVKRLIDRTRPREAEKRGYRRGKGRHNIGPYNSFPSGHTAGALAVSRALTREYPEAMIPAALFTTIVATAQTPEGNHYPSDVAAGAVVGWAAEAIVDWGFDEAERRGKAASSSVLV